MCVVYYVLCKNALKKKKRPKRLTCKKSASFCILLVPPYTSCLPHSELPGNLHNIAASPLSHLPSSPYRQLFHRSCPAPHGSSPPLRSSSQTDNATSSENSECQETKLYLFETKLYLALSFAMLDNSFWSSMGYKTTQENRRQLQLQKGLNVDVIYANRITENCLDYYYFR